MLSGMPAHLFWEWMAYNQIDPFVNIRLDILTGIIASTIANVNRPKGKKPFKPGDFIPKFFKRTQTWTEQLKIVEALNAALGGDDLRKN